MAIELRKTGISVVGDLPWGAHFCYFYETKQDLLDILIPYFKTGLENKEFCLWVISNSELLTVEEATSALRDALPDLDRYVAERSIEVVGHDDWFLRGHTFDSHKVANRFRTKLNEALARGYAGMRVNGSPAWLREAGQKKLRKYEAELDKLFPNERTIASCTYPLASIGGEEIFDVVRTHQFAIARRQGEWEVVETPELIQAKAEIKKLNEELEQRVAERTNELAAANKELRREIAERKQAEHALRRSEDHLRLVLDTTPALIHTGRPDGYLDYFNQRWLKYVGRSLEELQGWGWTASIHPDDVEGIVNGWRASIASGEPFQYEARVRQADGEYRWMLHRKVPLRDQHGNIVKWHGSSIDIEDRKQAEEKLLQSERQLAEAQRLAHIGSWDWDLRTNAVTWSDELYHIFGLQPGTISVAGEENRFIHPDDLDLGWDTVKRAIASKEPYDYYHRILRPDGTERIARSRGSIMSDERGEPIKVFGATQDVTELKRAEEKLKASSEQLRALSVRLQSVREEEATRIAREIHDELGSALTRLKWDLELLGKERLKTPKRVDRENSGQKIEEMIQLVDATVDTVRRISSELRPSILDDLGLAAALRWHTEQFQNRTGIVTDCDCSVENLSLNQAQSTAVFRIFEEALTNVMRHAGATKVEVRLEKDKGDLVVTIQDNGRGITEAEQLDPSSLGLLGMRERVNLIGGEISITGIAGEGTLVTVRLPISEKH